MFCFLFVRPKGLVSNNFHLCMLSSAFCPLNLMNQVIEKALLQLCFLHQLWKQKRQKKERQKRLFWYCNEIKSDHKLLSGESEYVGEGEEGCASGTHPELDCITIIIVEQDFMYMRACR